MFYLTTSFHPILAGISSNFLFLSYKNALIEGLVRIPYCWRWWTRVFALLFALVWSLVVWTEPVHGIGVWIARIFGFLFFIFATVSGETIIDPSRREVRRIWRLFGLFPLLTRTFPFDAFRDVRWRRRWIETEVDSEHWVELVPKKGRPLILTTFLSYERDRSCGDANKMALQLSGCLNLPMITEREAA
jgi:hypothetical protein